MDMPQRHCRVRGAVGPVEPEYEGLRPNYQNLIVLDSMGALVIGSAAPGFQMR